MKKHLSIKIIAGLLLILCNQLPAQTLQTSSSPYLDSCILVQMGIDHIPGLSACIVKEGQTRWVGVYGDANIEASIPVDTVTLFFIASVSKTITVTALMQLWEEGLFELDDDINDYMPFSVRIPNDTLAPITFRMLCTHTSSIRDNWGLMPVYWNGDSPIPLEEYLFDYLNPEGANYNQNTNFYNQPPGTDYNYCNIGVTLLGYLVELIGDSTFTYQTKERIFEPLQMNETAWFLSELDTSHIAMPYSWNGTSYFPRGYYGISYYPAGSLRTSVDQLANFMLCYLNGGTYLGQQILQSSTIEMIRTPQVPQINPGAGLIWHTATFGGRVLWGHSGGFYGVTTALSTCPEENTGVIILSNGDDLDFAPIVDLLFNYAEDSIFVTSVPSHFSDQNTVINNIWPNPISEKTTISYTLKKPDKITLQILNIEGFEVKTLVDRKQQTGEHKIVISNLDLPAGVYFCVIKTNNGIHTRKIIKL